MRERAVGAQDGLPAAALSGDTSLERYETNLDRAYVPVQSRLTTDWGVMGWAERAMNGLLSGGAAYQMVRNGVDWDGNGRIKTEPEPEAEPERDGRAKCGA